MIITICGSMVFSEEMLKVKAQLELLDHVVLIPAFLDSYRNISQKEVEKLSVQHKLENDVMRDHWEKIQQSDAILVLNYDRKGITNYIGGNSLLEIGFAYVLKKKIFLLNDIPEIEFYKSEIEAAKPIILLGDLNKIR